MVTDKERLPTLFLGDKESDIVLPRNPTGFSVIGGIECMFLLTLIANALSCQIFPLRPGFLTWKVLQTFMGKKKLWLHGFAEPESLAERET